MPVRRPIQISARLQPSSENEHSQADGVCAISIANQTMHECDECTPENDRRCEDNSPQHKKDAKIYRDKDLGLKPLHKDHDDAREECACGNDDCERRVGKNFSSEQTNCWYPTCTDDRCSAISFFSIQRLDCIEERQKDQQQRDRIECARSKRSRCCQPNCAEPNFVDRIAADDLKNDDWSEEPDAWTAQKCAHFI